MKSPKSTAAPAAPAASRFAHSYELGETEKRDLIQLIPAGKPHAYGAGREEPWSIYRDHFGSNAAVALKLQQSTTLSMD